MVEGRNPKAVVETERVVIRPWRLDDADRVYDIYRCAEVVKWFTRPPGPMQKRAEAVALIHRVTALQAVDPQYGSWAVFDRSSGSVAGTVILRPLPDGDGEVEIGWHLHPDSWGKGFASEAASALLAHAFANGLKEVWAVTDPENHRSIAVCRRIGMQLLGITHRWYHEPSMMFWAGAAGDQLPSLTP